MQSVAVTEEPSLQYLEDRIPSTAKAVTALAAPAALTTADASTVQTQEHHAETDRDAVDLTERVADAMREQNVHDDSTDTDTSTTKENEPMRIAGRANTGTSSSFL